MVVFAGLVDPNKLIGASLKSINVIIPKAWNEKDRSRSVADCTVHSALQ